MPLSLVMSVLEKVPLYGTEPSSEEIQLPSELERTPLFRILLELLATVLRLVIALPLERTSMLVPMHPSMLALLKTTPLLVWVHLSDVVLELSHLLSCLLVQSLKRESPSQLDRSGQELQLNIFVT